MNYPIYNIPNITKVFQLIDQLNRDKVLVLQQLRYFVEEKLEEKALGGATKWFCSRVTFEKYIKLSRTPSPSKCEYYSLFRRVMKSIHEPAFIEIIIYLERVQPNITTGFFTQE